MRHNEPNPVHLTTGHKDTPPIWMDRTLRLYGLIKEICRKLQLFSQDSTAPTHILGTPPLLLRHNEPNPVSSTTGHTSLNGLNLTQLSNTSAFRYMGQEATHPSHYTHVPFSIAFLHVRGENYVKVLSHGPNSKMYYTTLRSSSVLLYEN